MDTILRLSDGGAAWRHLFLRAELHFIVRKTRHLLASGYLPGDIGILHRKQWGLGRYSNALRAAGPAAAHLREDKELPEQAIAVRTMHLAKSLEYRVIFVGQLRCLFDTDRPLSPADRATFPADEPRLLHVGTARGRDTLYLTYQSRLPTEVAVLKRFLDAARSGAHGVPRE